MGKKPRISTLLLFLSFCQVYCQSFSLRNLADQVEYCNNKMCLLRPVEEFRKLTESVWKVHKRTHAPNDAKCEKATFSDVNYNGKTVTFNITGTMQIKRGVTNLLPGKPLFFKSNQTKGKRAKIFTTKEGHNIWSWCLLQFNPGVSYVSQMCSTQGSKTFAAISSFYATRKEDAEKALQSIHTAIEGVTLKLATYSGECDYDPTGPLTGWGGYYQFL